MTSRSIYTVSNRLTSLGMVRTSTDSPGAGSDDEHTESDLVGTPLVISESRELSERLHSLILGVVHHFS